MKKQLLLFLALGVSAGAMAQSAERQVVGSSGGSFSNTAMQVDYTVGEAVTASGSSGTFSVHQGFQQNSANVTSIKEENVLVNFSLYPNPAQDFVTLKLNAAKAFKLSLSLSNTTGQTLQNDKTLENVTSSYERKISLQGLASGIYFVNLYDENNSLLQSIRFIKQ